MDILSMTLEEVTRAFSEKSIQSFRARQVYDWLHKRLARSYDEMTNLPKLLRLELSESFPITHCETELKQVAADGTMKFLFSMEGGDYAECVLMKYKYGYSICVSSQIGCRMGCRFCASTLDGFKRNLSPGEMLSQVYLAQKEAGERISHIVLMGMGEPLENYDNVIRFLQLVSNEAGLNISMRNISLSTCGLVPKINELAQLHLQLTLSVSLHAPNDRIRNTIMPVSRKYKIEDLLGACKKYTQTTSRRISFEYAMLSGVNDSDECADELGSRLKGMLCHVNLIPVNEVAKSPFRPSSPERVKAFAGIVEKYGISVTVRRKLGSDIDASCGQLRRRRNTEGGIQNDSGS
ncbi:MAG: 23S rRNA (adenine(2503)-C(2))-methyltransferase RlmN [Clostridia bacterium]|nr:23S rRNA (adenine(2503)-C(2))-methyltransferase RlmN [Clostridia bacterium]